MDLSIEEIITMDSVKEMVNSTMERIIVSAKAFGEKESYQGRANI